MNALAPDLVRTLHASCDACFGTTAVWPLVEHAYGEPQRHYHTLAHLAELFAHLAPYRAEPLWPVIELAVWAHDFVYATTLSDHADNEARSAQWLVQVTNAHCSASWLRAHASHVSVAHDLVLATKSHRLPDAFASAPDLQRAGRIFSTRISRSSRPRPIDCANTIAQSHASGRRIPMRRRLHSARAASRRSNICARRPRCFNRRNSRRSHRSRSAISIR
ncbi:hypothetical protein GPU89_38175 [Burkholderia cepacia]|nr:hypothetical protein [Burkholderia cepacia]